MKKILSLLLALTITSGIQAKKVKFAVDMSTYTISPNGIHVIGDFQVIAGFAGLDWDPGTTLLTQEGSTTIYSIIVDIPAFQKYEFKFVNGNQTYESEFVPEESRVGYNFVDNRWLYVDSLSNDTTFPGAVIFGSNAPVGKSLIRYKVDMSIVGNVSTDGVHVGTSYQPAGVDPTKIRLYSFGSGVYEIINYQINNSYTYIFYNGKNLSNVETIPSSCSVFGNRGITLVKDTVFPAFCFSSCSACVGVGIKENNVRSVSLTLYPNPANDVVTIQSDIIGAYNVSLFDVSGKQIITLKEIETQTIEMNIQDVNSGIYFVRVSGKNGQSTTHKLVINK
jgi:hypothetical protein